MNMLTCKVAGRLLEDIVLPATLRAQVRTHYHAADIPCVAPTLHTDTQFWGEKRFALCYRTVVLSVLSCTVCDVGALWPNALIDQDETW